MTGESVNDAMSEKGLARRLVTYVLGMVVLSAGVVLNTKTGLGTSAMNTFPYAVHLVEGVSLGTASFIVYVFLVAFQLVLVRRFDAKIVLQLAASLGFGALIDLIDIYVLRFQAAGLVDGFAMLLVATALVGLGITLVVSQRLVPVAPDGCVQTIADVAGWEFGRAKYTFDAAFLLLTLGYGMLRVGWPVGIGLGTLAAVCLTGGSCSLWRRLIGRYL